MDWQDQGTLLSARPHGETSMIIEVFTERHGRHAGVVRGGASRRVAPVLQPGTELFVSWRARLEDHIGAFVVEPLRSRPGLMANRRALAGLNAVCGLLRVALAEREPHAGLWRESQRLLDLMAADGDWGGSYLAWEMLLLEDLGFGLDLSSCAVTGASEDLAYVSPRTGRAVSRAGAGDWADRLLPLPPILLGLPDTGALSLAQGLAITGHFLARELAILRSEAHLPDSRARLMAVLGGT